MEKNLPLVGDYALEVLSYYIWGKSSKPSNIVDEKYADKTGKKITIFSFYLF